MTLLEKFEKVDVRKETAIAQEDIAKLEGYQKIYDEFVKYMLGLISYFDKHIIELTRSSYSEFGISFKSSSQQKDYKRDIVKQGFEYHNSIVKYFEDKYKVKLPSVKREFNYKTEVTEELYDYYTTFKYDSVLDEIFVTMGSFDFSVKAEADIKEETIKECSGYYKDRHRINIKELTATIYASSYKIKKALNHFETGSTSEILECFKDIDSYKSSGELFSFTTTSKIASFQSHKVGQGMKIKFFSLDLMKQFANEYCGLSM